MGSRYCFYGLTNWNWTLESTDLSDSNSWSSVGHVTHATTDLIQAIEPMDATNRPIFFRVRKD